MQEFVEVLQILRDLGILPIVTLLFALPGGILLTIVIAKRYIFKGSGKFIIELFQLWHRDSQERTQVEVKLEERLADLAEEFKGIGEGLFENRRFLDDRITNFERRQEKMLEILDRIFRFIPKRREDWIKEES